MKCVWGAFAEEDDGGKDEKKSNLYDDGHPDQYSEGLGEVEHQDIGANAQLHQGHTIQVEQLSQPEVPQKVLHIARMCQDWIPDVSPKSNISGFVAEHCTTNCQYLVIVSQWCLGRSEYIQG